MDTVHRQSLIHRLEMILAAAMSAALVLGLVLITSEEFVKRKASAEDASAAWLSTLVIQAQSAMLFDDEKTAAEILQAASVYPGVEAVSVFRADGSVLAQHRAKRQPALSAADIDRAGTSHYFDRALTIALPVVVSGNRVGTVVARIDLMPMWRGIGQFVLAFVIVLGLTGVAATVVARQFLRRALAPITELKDVMSLVTRREEFTVRAKVAESDEVGALTVAFNSMLDQIARRDGLLAENNAHLTTLKEAAEQASNTKSEFLALMSHELRTPMAGVLGMLGLSLRGQMEPAVRERVEIASANASALLQIVNDLLDISKIEAGKMELEQVDFALRPMLDDATRLLHERAQQKSVRFILDVDPALPAFISGDPTRLRQVLLNLIGNAIKFTEEGSVTVSATLVDVVHGTPDRVNVRFEVRDTGIGMSEEAQGRMFQKFEQADTSMTRKFGGTGLGLSISKQLVELMGGQIELRSWLGEGSCFYFTVPLAVGVQPVETDVYEIAPHEHVLRVLVAEDSETNQLIIRALLEDMGHEVSAVENGQEALELLVRERFDLVLMDGRMPVMDGLEATGHIRRGQWEGYVFPDPKIKVIALTANASPQDRERFLAAGMDDFLTKPIDETVLHKTLSAMIEAMQATGKALPRRAVQGPAADAVLPAASSEANGQIREQMLQVFLDHAPLRMEEIEAAISEGDWAQAAVIAHGLKGSVGYLWPDSPAYALCAQMEVDADAREITAFIDRFVLLKQQLDAAREALTDVAPPVEPVDDDALGPLRELNARAGLRHMGGRRDLYLDILRRFSRSQVETVAQIHDLLCEGKRDDALRVIHTLKGLASTIGAERAEACARVMEALLEQMAPWRADDPAYQVARHELDAAMRAVIAEMAQVVLNTQAVKAEPVAAYDAGRALEAVQSLAEMLAVSNGDAPAFFAEHGTALQSFLGDAQYRRLAQMIEVFEFDPALALLRSCLARKDLNPPV